MTKEKLLFVYNANSDLFSSVTDFAHKIISPTTYACSLCALTYGNFAMKKDWKSFTENLPIETSFLHKDQFQKSYSLNADLPAVLIEDEQGLQPFVSKSEIGLCASLDELKNLLNKKLREHDQHYHSNVQ